jgi:hypothetical protein
VSPPHGHQEQAVRDRSQPQPVEEPDGTARQGDRQPKRGDRPEQLEGVTDGPEIPFTGRIAEQRSHIRTELRQHDDRGYHESDGERPPPQAGT